MATETVQATTHDDVHGQLIASESKTRVDEKEPVPQQSSVASQDPDNRQRGISSRNLKIDDLELIKTLGTGTFMRDASSSIPFPTN